MIYKPTATTDHLSVQELRKLPPQELDAILEAAALSAEQEYRTNHKLTDFPAFGEDDLHGTSGAAPAG